MGSTAKPSSDQAKAALASSEAPTVSAASIASTASSSNSLRQRWYCQHTKFSRANLATNRHLRSSHHQHAVVVPTLAPSHQEAVASASKLKQVQTCRKQVQICHRNKFRFVEKLQVCQT